MSATETFGAGAANVVGRVSDDPGEITVVPVRGDHTFGVAGDVVAIVVVVAEAAAHEKMIEAEVGEFQARGAFDVPGHQTQCDVGAGVEGVE